MKKKLFIISLAVLIVLGTLAFLPKSRAAGFGVGDKGGEVAFYQVQMCLGNQKQYNITLYSDDAEGTDRLTMLTFKNRDVFESVIKMLKDSRAIKGTWSQDAQALNFAHITVGE